MRFENINETSQYFFNADSFIDLPKGNAVYILMGLSLSLAIIFSVVLIVKLNKMNKLEQSLKSPNENTIAIRNEIKSLKSEFMMNVFLAIVIGTLLVTLINITIKDGNLVEGNIIHSEGRDTQIGTVKGINVDDNIMKIEIQNGNIVLAPSNHEDVELLVEGEEIKYQTHDVYHIEKSYDEDMRTNGVKVDTVFVLPNTFEDRMGTMNDYN